MRHVLTHTSGFAYDTWNQEMSVGVQLCKDNNAAIVKKTASLASGSF